MAQDGKMAIAACRAVGHLKVSHGSKPGWKSPTTNATNGTTYEGFLMTKDLEVGFEKHISKKISRRKNGNLNFESDLQICSDMVLKDLLC